MSVAREPWCRGGGLACGSAAGVLVVIAPSLVAITLAAGAGPARAQARLDPPAPLPEGVTPAVEQAIEKGLRYLAARQGPDGSWGVTPERPDLYPVAVTGLAGLAFLAHGDTVTRGPHAETVREIADYLLAAQSQDAQDKGLFSTGQEDVPGGRKGPRPMYGHAFAMTFLAQVYGQEGDAARRERIRKALDAAVTLTRRVQSEDGGWAYSATWWEHEGTLTVTQLQALRACRDVGIFVPGAVIDNGVRFIERSSNSDGSVRYRVDPSEEPRPGVTCAAVVALWNAGKYDSPYLKRSQDYVNRYIRHRWEREKHAEYVEYYLAQAKWVMGGATWGEFYRLASQDLVRLQQPDGHWEGADRYQYGTTFATAIALLVLQLPYDRLPVYQR
ncbi:MAG: terpene cyclase/mutase family protein [Planctomycetes bacterium]|nr:terpene cyclase/mutase family protein [Planctomycetota bacterium]